jgi:hypothetical protein
MNILFESDSVLVYTRGSAMACLANIGSNSDPYTVRSGCWWWGSLLTLSIHFSNRFLSRPPGVLGNCAMFCLTVIASHHKTIN